MADYTPLSPHFIGSANPGLPGSGPIDFLFPLISSDNFFLLTSDFNLLFPRLF